MAARNARLAILVAGALTALILLLTAQAAPAGAESGASSEDGDRPYDLGLQYAGPSQTPNEIPLELAIALFGDCSEALGLAPPQCGTPPVVWISREIPVEVCTFQAGRPGWLSASEFRASVQAAADAWNTAEAAVGVRYTGDCTVGSRWETENGRNEIGFDDARDVVTGSSAAVTLGGWTNFFPSGNPLLVTAREFTETDIVIDHLFDAPRVCFDSTIVHELGHALGLGHSDDPTDLMFPSFNPADVGTCPVTPSLSEHILVASLYGPDLAPTANGGADRTVAHAASVTLAASGSDPEGGPLTYHWAQLEGPPVTLETSPGSSSASFTAPSEDATLVFEVTVSDHFLHATADTVTITISQDVGPPSMRPAFASFLPGAGGAAVLGWETVENAVDYELCSSFSRAALASFCDRVDEPSTRITWDTVVGSAGSADATRVFTSGWRYTQTRACNTSGCSAISPGPLAGGLQWDAWGIDFDYFAIAFDIAGFQFTLAGVINVDGPTRVVEFYNGPEDAPKQNEFGGCTVVPRGSICIDFMNFDEPQDDVVVIRTRRPNTPTTEHVIPVR